MSVDIGFNITAEDLFKVNTYSAYTGQGVQTKAVAQQRDGERMYLAGYGMQTMGSMLQLNSQINSVRANINRKKMNIAQMSSSLEDSLRVQARKVSRVSGQQVAQLSRSGVSMEGSPLMVINETYRRGMEDYDAIAEAGKYQIDDTYQSIMDDLSRVQDAGRATMINSVAGIAQARYMMSK